ncbi:MAG: asparagine synthase-related protein [Nesterenkonia sp.]
MPHHQPSSTRLAASTSGVEPVFVNTTGDQQQHSGSLHALVESPQQPMAPDWNAWAQILALGSPLAGRTPFSGVHRLQPGETAEHSGNQWQLSQPQWLWEQVEPQPDVEPEDLSAEVVDTLRERIGFLEGPLNPMLSGGRDSRLLTALAAQQHQQVTAWSTSSDIGTSLEELVAARVADTLGVAHRIVPARHEEFSRDFTDYARTVDYMASFHIWLMPVARGLGRWQQNHSQPNQPNQQGTIVDGLGGGVFLGGGFPDDPELAETTPSPQQVVDSRFSRMARYLDAADEILAPGVGEDLSERARADFEPIARHYAAHPNGATLTAYLTRTLPGISMAPSRVLGGAQPTITPLVDDSVITRTLRIPHHKKYDGVWYPHLLRTADQRLAGVPTAADLSRRRQHTRRGASRAAAQWYRSLLLNSPVAELLSEQMRSAEDQVWSHQLARTKPQHLIRGLAMLALWLQQHQDQLVGSELPFGRPRHA